MARDPTLLPPSGEIVDAPVAPGERDRDLVRRCREELPYRTRSFEALVRRHEPRVFQTCLRYLGHREDAEEACQDIFLRVFHGLPSFREDARFRTWLFRIVQNLCATRYAQRKRRRERHEAMVESLQEDLVRRVDRSPSEDPDIEATLADFTADQRIVLLLRHVGQLSFAELAEVLEVSLSAAKMRLYRIEEEFRKRYTLRRK